eukprot:3216884-Pleurochrysis_carterae.AAC.2
MAVAFGAQMNRAAIREHRIAHGWNTSNAGQSKIDHPIARVTHRQRQVADGHAGSRLSIYAGHRLGARFQVYQILQVGMYVVCTSAVDDETNVFAPCAETASVFVTQARRARGHQGASARGYSQVDACFARR